MKYNISDDFGIFRKFKSTLNPLVLRIAKIFLSILPKGMRSSKDFEIRNIKIKTRDNKKIKIYIIKPKNNQPATQTIIYFHGGAFVFKGAPTHYRLAKQYAKESNSNVVFVDYRLAYCSKFLTSLNDCVDAYKNVVENKDIYGLNISNLVVAGDSAGGYLSLLTIIKAKEENLILPQKQMLIYPVVDSECETRSMQKFIDTPFWNAKLNRKMWAIYKRGNEVVNPLKLTDLTFMPTTYIETAEFDCLHDEGILLKDKLNSFNVSTVLYETKQTMHGFDAFKKSKITKDAIFNRMEFLKQK